MRIGLVGGTFDPIHIGHLLLGQWAMEAYQLDEVWYLPAGMPYYKAKSGISPAEDRLNMTALAMESVKKCRVCDMEVWREGATYTYETIERLNCEYPENGFYFIFGADCLDSLGGWRNPERILGGCSIIAAVRGTAELEGMRTKAEAFEKRLGGQIYVMDFPALEISSTLIRKRVREGKSICLLVPPKVEEYIHKKELYII